jgi:urease accessory protein
MRDWVLWQLADSAFPSGGFAHSAGLEAAVQLGDVVGPTGLERFVTRGLWQAGTFALPVVTEAHSQPPETIARLDRLCDAMTPSHVPNRASRAQGQALLRAAAAAFPEAVEPLASRVRAERLPGHLAPIAGAVLRTLGVPRDQAQRLFLFLTLRGVVSAGVRLGLVGPLEGQAIQARATAVAEQVLAECGSRSLDEAAQVDPVLDLLQGHQERLYSRLFQS